MKLANFSSSFVGLMCNEEHFIVLRHARLFNYPRFISGIPVHFHFLIYLYCPQFVYCCHHGDLRNYKGKLSRATVLTSG